MISIQNRDVDLDHLDAEVWILWAIVLWSLLTLVYVILGMMIDETDSHVEDWIANERNNRYGSQEKIPDSHLKSPIRDVFRKMLINPNVRTASFLKPSIHHCPISIKLIRIDSERIYGKLLSSVYKSDCQLLSNFIRQHYPAAAQIVYHLIQSLTKRLTGYSPKINVIPDREILALQTLKILWEDLRSFMQTAREDSIGSNSGKWKRHNTQLNGIGKCYYCAYYCLLELDSSPGIFWALDYDQVMMIADTIASRVNALSFSKVLPNNCPGRLSPSILAKCYRLLDEGFLDQGNAFFDQVSKWESCLSSIILEKFDRLEYSKNFVSWFKRKCSEDELHYMEKLRKYLMDLDLTPNQYAELHGMYRHWGHPTVDELEGCKKVKGIAKNRDKPNPTIMRRITGVLKRSFILQYINKHGRWPKVLTHLLPDASPLRQMVDKKVRVFNLYSPHYPLEDWALLRFGKEFTFDYYPDFTDCIEDTACSVEKPYLRSVYSTEALGYFPKKGITLRRVLLEILRRSDISIQKICETVQLDLVPDDWLIILVHSKEREMKIIPRLFCMMVLEMRLYFCVTELNVSKTIFPYFPQQTMTMSGSELEKRLFNLTGESAQEVPYLAPVIGIDFKSWNLCWTYDSTHSTFEFLDDLFGTPGLFVASHKFFRSCVVSLASYHSPPSTLVDNPTGELEECDTLWYDHAGGFEGIRQKCWTLITIGLLLYVEVETGIKSYIIGQGDNQVVKLILPIPDGMKSSSDYLKQRPEEIKLKIDAFMRSLSVAANGIGLEVKEDETWVSLDFVVYGKDMMYRGSYLSQALKRISRLFPDVNEVYPNLHTKLASLQTAGLNASQKSFCIVSSYFLSTVEVLMTFSREVYMYGASRGIKGTLGGGLAKWEVSTLLSTKFKEFFLLLSSDVGGVPVLPFISFLYRGHPDPLTMYTTNLVMYSQDSKMARQILSWLLKGKFKVNEPNPELLVTNPSSINIRVAEFLQSQFKDLIESSLINRTRNNHLRELFNDKTRENDRELFKYLCTTSPMYPRVIHELYRQTPTGTKFSFIAKFSNTRTTQSLISDTVESRTVMSHIRKGEIVAIRFLLTMFTEIDNLVALSTNVTPCPTHLAQMLRDVSWAKTVNGQRIQGSTIPHPAHQFTPEPIDPQRITHLDKNKLILNCLIFLKSKLTGMDLLLKRGPYPAFLGSRTREKLTGKIFQVPKHSAALASAERLIQIAHWTLSSSGTISQFIWDLIVSRTDVSPELMLQITSLVSGGSITHRLNDHATKRQTLHTFRPNITTHIYFSTDYMGKFNRGLLNYNLHFQGAEHLGFTIYELLLVSCEESIPDGLVLRFTAECCEEALEEERITSFSLTPKIKIYQDNPLVYTKMLDMLPLPGKLGSNQLVQLVTVGDPAMAAASLVFQQLLRSSQIAVVGFSILTNPNLSDISVADVVSIGIRSILERLSILLFLYLPLEEKDAWRVFQLIPLSGFRALASLTLVPEVYPQLCALTGREGSPDAFLNIDVVCSLLKRILSGMIGKCSQNWKERPHLYSKVIHFTGAKIGLYRILKIWSRQIYICTGGAIDLDPLIQSLEFRVEFLGDLTHSADLSLLWNQMVQMIGPELSLLVGTTCPLILCRTAPEINVREARLLYPQASSTAPQSDINRKQVMLRLSPNLIPIDLGSYPMSLTCPIRGTSIISLPLKVSFTSTGRPQKQRVDQQFRLYGNISTSHLKVLEILITENIKVSGPAVTLAEGEGSIAKLLLDCGAPFVYHNTLIEKNKIVPQHGVNFVPACLAGEKDRVKMGLINVLTGGDITRPETLHAICSRIDPQDFISIVTCDAESPAEFNPRHTIQLLMGWLIVCVSSRANSGLFKMFCVSEELTLILLGVTQTVFHSVKVIVPTFSSHENFEAYILGQQLIPMLDLEDLWEMRNNPDFYKITASTQVLTTSVSLFTGTRIHSEPFQVSRFGRTLRLWSLSKERGVEDNLRFSYMKITGGMLYNSSLTLKENLLDSREKALDYMSGVIKQQVEPYYGAIITTAPSLITKQPGSLHGAIENCLDLIFVIDMLIQAIEKDSWSDAVECVTRELRSEKTIQSSGQTLYVYRLPEETFYDHFVKYFWRIWGHYRWRDYHLCVVK